MENSPPVFISHSSQDKAVANAICAALEADGSSCWIAPRNISFGTDWSQAIVEAIAACRVMILLFSGHANDSPQVRREVQRAFEHDVPVIPVRVEDVLPHPALEYYISSVHWLNATEGLLPIHLEQLTAHVRKLLQKNNPATAPQPASAAPPVTPPAVPAPPPVVPAVPSPPLASAPAPMYPPGTSAPAAGTLAAPASGMATLPAAPDIGGQLPGQGGFTPESAPLPPPSLPPTNLPEPATSFIGRENVLAAVMRHMQNTRLLTLTGSGGSGKTRLALEVAARVRADFPDGVWLIELEALSAAELIGPMIAAVLNVDEEPGRDIINVLTDALQAKTLLLVFDNAEHLLQPVAGLCAALLRRCPHARLLVTSQERLSLAGEQSYRVPTLTLPDRKLVAAAADPVVKAMESEAVRLFMERAVAYRRDFALTRGNAAVVANLCARLDGVPLAIELAAARVRSLSVEDIDSRLENCFRLLTGGNRAALPRQQTLRAALDWSYDLLAETEQALFTRLAAFTGGWTLEAAESVCSGEDIEDWEVLDVLAALCDKSLVVFEERENFQRYHMLNIVRLYALEKLSEGGQEADASERHADYFGRFVAQAKNAPSLVEQYDAIEREHDNLRLALDTFLARENAGEAVKMCLGMAEYWWQRGWIPEGAHFLNKTLAGSASLSDGCLLAGLYAALGWTAYLQANYSQAASLQQRSLELWQAAGDRAGEARALNNLAVGAQAQSRFDEARGFYTRSLDISRELGDELKQAAGLSNLGLLSVHEGRYEEARSQLDAARLLYERNHDPQGTAISLCNLTDLALRTGETSVAKSMAECALQHFRSCNDRPGIAFTLVNLAEVAVQEGEGGEAVERTREAMRVSLETGLRGLIPTLLDVLARAETLRGQPEAAYFCFAGAEKLRQEMQLPRLLAEEEPLEQLRSGPFAALDETAKRGMESKVALMSLEALVSATILL